MVRSVFGLGTHVGILVPSCPIQQFVLIAKPIIWEYILLTGN